MMAELPDLIVTEMQAELSLWCDTCALSTAQQGTFMHQKPGQALEDLELVNVWWCEECETVQWDRS